MDNIKLINTTEGKGGIEVSLWLLCNQVCGIADLS